MVKYTPKIIGLAIFICLNHAASAQTFLPCQTNETDVDDDGYGWENNSTCIIDTNEAGPKSFTNLETGLRVNLVRAYWEPVDFDKDIACSVHAFDGSQYQRINDSITGYLFTHIPTTPPYDNVVRVSLSHDSQSVDYPWSVENGVYNGPGDIERSHWIEIKDHGINQSAVRIWFLDETYTVCSSINLNDSFIPTGSPLTQNSCVDTDGDGWGWNGVTSCRTNTD